jgi:hypothetical protein
MDRTQISNLDPIPTRETTTEVWRVSRNRQPTVLIKKDTNNQAPHGDRAAVAIPLADTIEEGRPLKFTEIEHLY